MCSPCSDFQKKAVSFGCSFFLILFAIVVGTLWPSLSSKVLHDQLVLKNGSTQYKKWIRTPIPMYLEIYMFNWTNPEASAQDPTVKPHFEELGPYVFHELHERVNLTWNINKTVTFQQRRTWHFAPELSRGSLDDTVTNLNVIALNVAYFLRNSGYLKQWVADKMVEIYGNEFWHRKKVSDLLFDGLDDKLLNILKDIPGIEIPFDKFGWFVNRNLSETYDGTFTMRTGEDSLENTGMLTLWKGAPDTGLYRGRCGEVQGTTGELWPVAYSNKTNVTLFAGDICRSLTLDYGEEITIHELQGGKYVGGASVFDNGIKYPQAACWCNAAPADCPDLKPGVFNASACKFNSPTFVSYPHFYLADPSYREPLDGMRPNKTLHEFYMAIEPHTGTPLDVRAQLQINLLLQPIEGFKMYKKVPRMMIPMFWFNQHATLTESLAKQIKLAVMLPALGIYVAIFFGTIGTILVAIFVGISLKRWSAASIPYEELNN